MLLLLLLVVMVLLLLLPLPLLLLKLLLLRRRRLDALFLKLAAEVAFPFHSPLIHSLLLSVLLLHLLCSFIFLSVPVISPCCFLLLSLLVLIVQPLNGQRRVTSYRQSPGLIQPVLVRLQLLQW